MLEPLETIQTFVVPAVMISANGLLALAFYNRLTAVVNRVRAINKERFDLVARLAAMNGDSGSLAEAGHVRSRIETLHELGHQLADRAGLMRRALLGLLSSVLSMIGCSLALGMSPILGGLDWGALLLFVAGMAAMAFGVIEAFRELWASLGPLVFEHETLEQPEGTASSIAGNGAV